jgi:hypothetical protein
MRQWPVALPCGVYIQRVMIDNGSRYLSSWLPDSRSVQRRELGIEPGV